MNIIEELRALSPDRALDDHEARSIAERQATRLLKLTGITDPAVPSEIISELPRITVERVHALPSSGLTIIGRGRRQIMLNADDHPLRQRFSLAHELKHIIDHTMIDRLYEGDRFRTASERAETICDYFAACLLMPRPWMKRAFTSGIQQPAELAQLFGVSRQAMIVRLSQLGLVEPKARCGKLDAKTLRRLQNRHRSTRYFRTRALRLELL